MGKGRDDWDRGRGRGRGKGRDRDNKWENGRGKEEQVDLAQQMAVSINLSCGTMSATIIRGKEEKGENTY